MIPKYLLKTNLVVAMLLVATAGYCQTTANLGAIDDAPIFSRLTGSAVASQSVPLNPGASVFTQYVRRTEQDRAIKNIITLSLIEETPYHITNNFTATVKIKIEYGPSAFSLNTIAEQALTVSYTKEEGAKYNAKNYFHFTGAEYVRITVNEISPATVGSIDTRELLLLENEIRATRYYELAANVLPTAFTVPASAPAAADNLPVSWVWPSDAGNNFTQLEWTWLENELENNFFTNGVLDINLLFQNNATRIDIFSNQLSYSIPLLYDGAGKLYCRIRAVAIKKSGNRSDGPWSAAKAASFSGHNGNLNWQATTSFAEEGKLKTVMQYYDGSLRNRQTVTKDNITNTTITAETFYDGQGRPAIQILPAPGINNVIAYTKNLNLFNGQVDNEDPLSHFDLEPIATPGSLTKDLKTTSGAAQYYSSSNPELNTGLTKNIPDAEGYPYTVTRYTPDATGRIMAQSGVGLAMRMSSGQETKYYYGTPAQEELDGLFGTEVGYFSHYFKNMVKDANGQMSVSYVDMHGRTIATALAGDAPANTTALNITNATYYPGQAGSTITRNLLDSSTNTVKGNSIESIHTILVPALTNYEFTYKLIPDALQLPSCTQGTLCFDCMYDLEFSITDESGDTPPIVKRYSNINVNADDNCATATQGLKDDAGMAFPDIITFSQSLAAGSYTLRKTLTISEASLQKYKEEYLLKGLCKTEQQLIDSIYAVMLSVSDCDNPVSLTPCQQCTTELGDSTTFRNNYLASLNNPPLTNDLAAEIRAAYTAGKQNCDRLCNTVSQNLPTKRQLMLADMIPYSGQYAMQFQPDGNATVVAMYNKYNIFSTTTAATQPFYKKPWNKTKAMDYYYTSFNAIDKTIHPDLTPNQYLLLNATSRDEFTQLFNNKWAEALLPHHPEYDKLVFAETNLANSYNWINTFNNTTTYAAATAAGYIFTSSTNLTDPFYTVASTNKSAMATKISSTYFTSNGKNYSMWQIAYGDAMCKTIADPNQRENCYNTAPKIPPYNNLTTAQKDQVWNLFKQLYAVERDIHVNAYIAASRPLADAGQLVAAKYILHFPTDNTQAAAQYEWTWYTSTPGAEPIIANIPGGTTPAQIYSSNCNSYIDQWKQALLQCPALSGHANKDQILSQITTAMVAVCEKGSNAANPNGSSNVAPATPNDGSPRSFEEVINTVFANNGIQKNTWCNPFVIEYPKPFDKGTKFTNQITSLIDECNCSRFTQLKNEATAAGYNAGQLSSLNQYFNSKYGETITAVLYDALGHCSELGAQSYCHTEFETISYLCDDGIPTILSITSRTSNTPLEYLASSSIEFLPNFESGVNHEFTARIICPATKQPPILCDPGYHWDDALQKCVADASLPTQPSPTPTPAPTPAVAAAKVIINPIPITCEQGYHWDDFSQQCVEDAPPPPPPPPPPATCTRQCSVTVCETMLVTEYPLVTPQPFPNFLNCGFTATQRCLDCAQLSALTAEFKAVIPAPYNAGPIITGDDLTPQNINDNILYQRFINYRTGFEYGWMDYVKAAAAANCDLGRFAENGNATQNVICGDTKPLNDTTGFLQTEPPCQKVLNMAIAMAQQIYEIRTQTLLADFETAYRARCLSASEDFSVRYASKEYHYTLYYYDLAGNLLKTVPPLGARPDFSLAYTNSVKNARKNNTFTSRSHAVVTQYRYNSLGLVIAQSSPDAGISKFWYDKLGRLAVSQNAQQAAPSGSPEGGGTLRYSYTLYDALGRIAEVGQKPHTTLMTQAISQNEISLQAWINTAGTKEQITRTSYDLSYEGGTDLLAGKLSQRNLRSRVSYTMVFDSDPGAALGTHKAATFFTYDVHGNVDTLLQDYNGISELGASDRFKLIAYEYDLISGKVNNVSYQPGQWDAFYHKYNYDAENRLLHVKTSRDKIVWERDAEYNYYKHGPLARTELGQLRVQGLDYAYTLQGWLKGVNSTNLDANTDIGRDGTAGANKNVARDIVGFALHYYDQTINSNHYLDYKPISGLSAFATAIAAPIGGGVGASLYNGNISAISINNGGLLKGAPATTNALPLLYTYQYDQLNRLVNMQAYKGLDSTFNVWNAIAINDYKEAISYDPNGNILTYNRNGSPSVSGQQLEMDGLSYTYYANKNQLQRVNDAAPATNYTEDIDGATTDINYTYDAIGNLKTDASEGITNISWTVYGKIAGISKTNGTTINYTYDAAGNRISKNVINPPSGSSGGLTIYVRDASGNVMSVYQKPASTPLKQIESHVYGSSRLGIAGEQTLLPSTVNLASGFNTATIQTFTRGEKFFELANHLGNVLVTISDKKLGVPKQSDPTLVDYYNADVVTANDFYPFGQLQPGRQYGTLGRYGFNGKEQDPEIKGTGTQYDYGFRIYDPRLGRFLSVDPLTKKYPELTPYQFASNRPIDGIDLDGLEYATFRIYVDKNQKVTKIAVTTDYQLKQNGSEGPGVKYVIYRVNEGNRPDEVRFEKNMYGIYQGSKNPRLPKVGENYKVLHDDYSLDPIDETDANAKQHDQDYDAVKLRGFNGVLDDKSTPANEAYIKKADKIIEKQKKGEKDDVTKKPVTKEAAKAAKKGRNFFRGIENLKKLKGSRFPTQ